MRPLALQLQAFGSYAGEFEIDFARLGRHGVFSITGPTGSGKSTIFDAIVYALYDDLPGFRSDSHIRSQYADEGTMTSVTFTFEADGKEWVVERSPSQMRPRLRGGGTPVPSDSKVVLNEVGADGGGITRKASVATELLRLVGLTKAQFEQVVLIPQGKFEEVLKADTKDRALLLARLFPVEVYRRTTESLRELAASRKAEYEGLSAGSDALVEQIRVDIVEALGRAPLGSTALAPDDPSLAPDAFDQAQFDLHREELERLATAVGVSRDDARTELAAFRSRRVAAEAQAARWEQWQSDLRAAEDFPRQEAVDQSARAALERARTVVRVGPALTQWRAATDALVKGEADEVQIRTSIDEDWVDLYDHAALDRASTAVVLAIVADGDANALEAADVAHDALLQRERDLAEVDVRLTEGAAGAAASAAAFEAAASTLAASRTELAAAVARTGGRGQVEIRVNDLERALDVATKRSAAVDLVTQLETDVAGAAESEGTAGDQLGIVRDAWRAGLAGRLAAHLSDGEPCPTCGSKVHPTPALATEDAPDDDALQQAEAVLLRRTSALQALRVELAKATAAAEALAGADDDGLVERLAGAHAELQVIVASEADAIRREAEVEAQARDLASTQADVAGEAAALQADRATQAARRQQWESERADFVTTHGAFTSTAGAARSRRRLAEAVARLAASLQTSESASAALAQSLGMLVPALTEFGADDPAELEQWARPADEIEAESAVLEQRALERSEVETRIQQYVDGDGPAVRPDGGPLLVAEGVVAEQFDDLVGRLAVITSRVESIDAARGDLTSRTGAIETARRNKEEADTLATACAGLGGGQAGNRVSLENWVLAYYLRQVLAQANLRLDTMTGGRYALELNREYTDGRKPWGLDLSVLDAETGQTRPATTLSGGETFMAALSLALGLADVVSAGSNYTIGALFVDEGFGSLDAESLDTVIDVLRSLQDGGRMVGVISHVQDLKDALPNGITIESTNLGSKASIHYPEG